MRWLKLAGAAAVVIAIIAIGFMIGDWWSGRQSADELAALRVKLAQSAETLEIQKDLYAVETIQTFKLKVLLDVSREEVGKLYKHLEDTKAELLTTQQISLRWKKAYEAALAANQTDEPPDEPDGVVRKRVEFTGNLGPIKATGHTLTDPPEAYLKLEQVVPLILTVAVAQNKDKSWSSYVTSSDENIDVKINLAGVNPLILSPRWYQRIWVDLGAAALGNPGASIGLSYRGDRYSLGAMCMSTGADSGCGATLGVRIFK